MNEMLELEKGELRGTISISRPTGPEVEYISIEVTDELSRTRFVDIRVPLGGFVKALTGQGFVPCVFEHRPDMVGMTAESKEETVPFAWDGAWDEREAAARAALSAYEIDGWRGNVRDMLNHHNQVDTGAGRKQLVTFHRHVPTKGKP